ncbi:MAG: ABC transporter substrate-binding protein [Ilumatobacteraceae bacterium]
MTNKRTVRFAAVAVALGLVAAACGGDADTADEPAAEEPAAEEPAAEEPAAEEPAAEEPAAEEPAAEEPAEMTLADVCPSPIVIQTDWFPESEHGALYNLIGDDYVVDAENQTVTGTLVGAGNTPTDIQIQVRAGGPAIGFAAPRVQMYTDDSIHLGYTSTDGQVLAWEDAPLISVIAPLEINPQIIMWDADAWPDVETIADLGTAGTTINIFGGGGFSDVFVAKGIWTAEQVDPSYDGSPARFIAEGNIAQQGFASAEPYNYEFVFEEYGKAPKYQLLHDAGYPIYSQTLGVKPTELENLRGCLEMFVPMVQTSTVEFSGNPDRANAMIIDTVAQVGSFWVYDEGVANYAVETMSALGLHSNGPDSTVGNMDEARVQGVIDDIAAAGLPVPEGLTAADTFTNEFIDESIGF